MVTAHVGGNTPRRGFGLLGLFLTLALIEAGLGLAGELWSSVVQREREEDLRFRLTAYHRAIQAYRATYKRGPSTLGELLSNPRGIKFLQRLYLDPMAQGAGPRAFLPVPGRDGRILSVKSGSGQIARNGSVYSEWKVDAHGILLDGIAGAAGTLTREVAR
ncbi:MAG: hypothetical protein HY303_08790 [Candidatus Wallbacteria bacterium]|nr:hypothetical protein [Candidatus Wallbacteria bacterium]